MRRTNIVVVLAFAGLVATSIRAQVSPGIVRSLPDEYAPIIGDPCRPTSDRVIKLYPSGLERYCNATTKRWTALSTTAWQFDVQSFGAVCDGVTDDVVPIRTAFAAACIDGGIVEAKAGRCMISDVVQYCSNTIVRGPGIFELMPGLGSTPLMFEPIDGNVENVVFEGLTFNHRGDLYGTDNATPTLSVNATSGVTIRECVFENAQTMAVWADSGAADPTTDLRITNNRITYSAAGGFSLFGAIRNFTISNNEIRWTADDAIAIQDNGAGDYPSVGTIANNVVRNADIRVAGSTPAGIRVYGAEDVAVSDNVIDSTVACGICVQDGANSEATRITVAGNTIHNAGVASKHCSTDTTTRCTVDGDCTTPQTCVATDVTGVPNHGIYVLDGAEDVTLSGNQVYGSVGHGIKVAATGTAYIKRISITGNVSSGNGGSGLVLDKAQEFTVSSNVLMNNGSSASEPYGILLIDDAGTESDPLLKHGIISANRAGDSRSGGARTQTHGIYWSSAVSGSPDTQIQIWGNDLTGNVTAESSLGELPAPMSFPIGAGFISSYPGTAMQVPPVDGLCVTMDTVGITGRLIVWDGVTKDSNRTYQYVQEPTANRTQYLPDKDGTYLLNTDPQSWDFTLYQLGGLVPGTTYESLRRAKQAITLTAVACESDTGTAVVNLQRDDGSPFDVLSSDCTCGTTPTACTISGSEDNFAATVTLDAEHVSGAATRINFFIAYTLD